MANILKRRHATCGGKENSKSFSSEPFFNVQQNNYIMFPYLSARA